MDFYFSWIFKFSSSFTNMPTWHQFRFMTAARSTTCLADTLPCRLGGLPSCVKCISYPENCDNCFIDTVLLADRNFSKENKISESIPPHSSHVPSRERGGGWQAAPLCQRQTRQWWQVLNLQVHKQTYLNEFRGFAGIVLYIQQCINTCIYYRTTQLSLTDENFSRV